MDGNTRPRPSLDRYELLYRLMVIAAIAVILVSLVGIASMTGLLPRVSDGRPNTEAIPDKRGNDAVRREGAQPADGQPALRTVPVRYRLVMRTRASCSTGHAAIEPVVAADARVAFDSCT